MNIYLGSARFQTSAAKYTRSALLWETARRIVIIQYRRFGIPYGCHLRRSRNQRRKAFSFDSLTLEDETDRLSRNVGKELSLYAAQFPRRAQISCTSRQKSEITQSTQLWKGDSTSRPEIGKTSNQFLGFFFMNMYCIFKTKTDRP